MDTKPRLHVLQHVAFEGPDRVLDWAKRKRCEITTTRFDERQTLPKLEAFDWLLVMGGPMAVYETDTVAWMEREIAFVREAVHAGKKVLGICLGAQILAAALGAKVFPGRTKEIGWLPAQVTPDGKKHPVFQSWPSELTVFQWHGDTFDLPAGAVHCVSSVDCAQQAFSFGENVLALQFHLEVSEKGMRGMLEHLGAGLPRGIPTVQSPEQILSGAHHTRTLQVHLDAMLDRFFSSITPQ